jgi:hypothetical protein
LVVRARRVEAPRVLFAPPKRNRKRPRGGAPTRRASESLGTDSRVLRRVKPLEAPLGAFAAKFFFGWGNPASAVFLRARRCRCGADDVQATLSAPRRAACHKCPFYRHFYLSS